MIVQIDLGEWFVNIGIVGFNRIVKHAQDNYNLNLNNFNYQINNNCIEFDHKLLENFHEYYFNYFLDNYNRAENDKKRMDNIFHSLEKSNNSKETIKHIKNIVDEKKKKAENINSDLALKISQISKEIGTLKIKEDGETLKILLDEFHKINSIEELNTRVTLNYFKSFLSDSFFGQQSFLNVLSAKKTLHEQKNQMYKDYLRDIIYEFDLKEIGDSKDYEKLKVFIISYEKKTKENPKERSETLDFILKKAKKLNRKNYINEIFNVLDDKNIFNCSILYENKSFGLNFADGHFIPLGTSFGDQKNALWNFNDTIPICNLAKLLFFCSPAGTVELYKTYLKTDENNLDFKEMKYFSFVNYDSNLIELIDKNDHFCKVKDKSLPMNELIMDLVSIESKKSEYQLKNILFVEFNMSYMSKKCKLNYFNIPDNMIILFNEEENVKNIKCIFNREFKMEILDYLLKNKNLYPVIQNKIRYYIKNWDTKNLFLRNDFIHAVLIQYVLNKYKGDKNVEKKKIWAVYNSGYGMQKLIEGIEDKKDDKQANPTKEDHSKNDKLNNKIKGIGYRLLNTLKTGNKDDFMDIIIRLYLANGRKVPSLVINAKKELDMTFEDFGYTFISGLLGEEYDNKKGVNKNE